jgi:hypothetical protein
MDEKQIQRIMSGLKCSREEAIEIIQADKAIDRGERMDFDLDKETEKEAKKYANVREKTVRTPKKTPVRKENATKSQIIADIFAFLVEKGYENVNITNKERQISFKIGENDYELTLVQKRKPKT